MDSNSNKTIDLSKNNMLLVGIILAFIIIAVGLTFLTAKDVDTGNAYVCGNQVALFRANISDCMKVPVEPSDEELTTVLTNPAVNALFVLVEPNGTAGVGLASHEIFKTVDALKPVSGIDAGVVYTAYWPDQPNVPVLGLENATYNYPVIYLIPNQNKTKIEVDGPRISVYAEDQYGLDASACKIAILLINEFMDC